jgi:drug/metabolite transporter (DMT)-like permease
VITPAAGVFLFGEQMRRLHVVGTVLIVAGVAFLLSGD